MKYAALVLLLGLSQSAGAFQVNVVTRSNLKFEGSSAEVSSRNNETFDVSVTDSDYEELIKKSVMSVATLLPPQYLPSEITINLETQAIYTNSQGNLELIPMSVLLSTQLPGKDQIRICDYEIKNNPAAVQTLLAHETGHMIIEWAWRSAGVVPSGELFGWIWTKSIYEGVADYFSATVNRTTSLVGGSQSWYGRDIFTYTNYEDAKRQTLLKTVEQVRTGLQIEGLLQLRAYSSLIQGMEDELQGSPQILDSNAEGSWLAGQLWLLNAKYGQQKVIDAILKIALTGQKRCDIQAFLNEVKLSL